MMTKREKEKLMNQCFNKKKGNNMFKFVVVLLAVSVFVNMISLSFVYDLITYADISIADPQIFSRFTLWILNHFYI